MEIDNNTTIANILSNDIYTSSIPKIHLGEHITTHFTKLQPEMSCVILGFFLSPTFTRLGGTSVSHLKLDGWDALSSQKTLCWKASKSKLFRTSGSQVPWLKRTFLACNQSCCYGLKQTKTTKASKLWWTALLPGIQKVNIYIYTYFLQRFWSYWFFPQKKLNSGKLIQLYHDSHDRSCLDTQSSQGQLRMMLFLWGHRNHSQALEKTNKTKTNNKKKDKTKQTKEKQPTKPSRSKRRRGWEITSIFQIWTHPTHAPDNVHRHYDRFLPLGSTNDSNKVTPTCEMVRFWEPNIQYLWGDSWGDFFDKTTNARGRWSTCISINQETCWNLMLRKFGEFWVPRQKVLVF